MGTETETVVSVFLPAAQRETLNELEFRKFGESEGVVRTNVRALSPQLAVLRKP